jgi:anti-sigma regulatory factor (Ser/Thr protein kinase)
MSYSDDHLKGEILAPTRSTDLSLIRQQLLGFMKVLDYSPGDLFAVGLALEEALTNAETHGNRDDASKRVRVAYQINKREVRFEIEDEGEGFRLSDVPDPRLPEYVDRPHGRGLLMMQLYMTEIEHNARGNCVTMHKLRDAVSEQAVHSA